MVFIIPFSRVLASGETSMEQIKKAIELRNKALEMQNKGNYFEAFLFAIAVAVGVAPEMIPTIVSMNLSKGAFVLSKKKVIVKHLDAIENLGVMDILCTDKTGTITEGRIVLEKYLDIKGAENEDVLHYAFIVS